MTNHFIRSVVETARPDLASSDGLRLAKKLTELEEKCQFASGQDNDGSLKLLYVHLVREAIHIENVYLCLLALKKLKLNNLLRFFNLDLATPREILKLVSNYFQIDEPNQQKTTREQVTTRNSILPGVENYVITDQDLKLVKSFHIGLRAQGMPTQLIQLRDAQDNETEENFGDALTLYESSGTHYENFLRVSMKHLMCASHDVLQKYCKDKIELRSIWFNYLIECGRYIDAISFCDSIGDETSSLYVKHIKQQRGNQVNELLPGEVREFLLAGQAKWTNARQLDMASSIAGGFGQQKSLFAEIAAHHLKHDRLNLALSMSLTFGQANQILDQYLARHDYHPINLGSLSRSGAVYFSNSQLLYHLINAACYGLNTNPIVIKSACIDLGLLDELLQMIALQHDPNDQLLGHMLERLEGIMESGLQERLDMIDPKLSKSTMSAVLRFLKREDERETSMKMITIMIAAINIFLMKLDPLAPSSTIAQSVSNLEIMFDGLSEYLEELTFNATDDLVRAINNLVIAIKSRLDALADSEIIRDNFMKIVDKIAGLCLIDARYKSAAILYSQVEDNVSAIKALMRTGETDTVMNYALLVRDITVNRITINYIKHLKLEPEVIEDFIRRSKL
jgi:hypothetical protein